MKIHVEPSGVLALLLCVATSHQAATATAFFVLAPSTLIRGGASAVTTPSSKTTTTTTKLLSATLSEQELLELISDDSYAMDISSITEGSEKETYIGQGSGVNEGTGIGALSGFFMKLVGKFLTWKNRPIFDKLWTVIERDLLKMVQERVPIKPSRTWFANKDAPPSAHSFATEDGQCEGTVSAYKGGRIDWITTCKFFSKQLGFGNMRIDGWCTRDTRAPHMAVHLCIVFNVIFIYISLVPRTNLVFDDEYNDYVNGSPKTALDGKSLNDLHIQCVEDKAFKQYVSKSHVVNAFMVSPNTLLYTIPYNKKNFNKVRKLSMDYVATWLDMLEESDGVLMKDVDSKATQAELLRYDVRTRQFCGRDPDTKNVVKLFGLETSDLLVRTLWGDPDDRIWSTR